MPDWIRIILLAASLGRWTINTPFFSLIPLFSPSWHCWRAMGWRYFKGGFWELCKYPEAALLRQQGKGCRDSSQGARTPCNAETLCAMSFFGQNPSLGALLCLPASLGWGRTSLDPTRHQHYGCGSGWEVSLPKGPRAAAKLGLDIDIESWLFERHNSLCLLQS